MGTCIICGADVEGPICRTHEEDAWFEFQGSRPNQLTTGRYYRGTVDGFADFGVFVDINSGVTGLLHRSELPTRLENLDWDAGQPVFVQVTGVRDNGNVDLGWSIRQSDREFRGALIDSPDGDYVRDESGEAAEESDTAANTEAKTGGNGDAGTAEPQPSGESDEPAVETTAANGGGAAAATVGGGATAQAKQVEPTHRPVDALSNHVGQKVRLEAEVVDVRQTSGPTIFEVADESGTVDCAAFVEAGVRAYPEIEVGDYVRLDGEIERRRGDLQVETEALEVLDDDARDDLKRRVEDSMDARTRPPEVELLADEPAVAAIEDDVRDAAQAIRRAIIESRPIVVRHLATADGYVAGAAIEHAVLPMIRDEHENSDAEYHYFDRRPLEDRFYDMDDVTKDVSNMLGNNERHGEKMPLFVLAGAGATSESADSYELLSIYGADAVVVDGGQPDAEIADLVDVLVNPNQESPGADLPAGVLASNIAIHVNPDVRDDIRHLPAVSYWSDVPESYATLADEAGYDADAVTDVREAISLEAYYQSYDDKRELITDLLFEPEHRELAGHVAEQFRIKLGIELETAEPHLTLRGFGDVMFRVLDVEAFTHRFDFPASDLLLTEIHRQESEHTDDTLVTLGTDADELHIRSDEAVDLRAVADRAREEVPDAGLRAKGTTQGKLEFLRGERDEVVDAVVQAIATELEN